MADQDAVDQVSDALREMVIKEREAVRAVLDAKDVWVGPTYLNYFRVRIFDRTHGERAYRVTVTED